MATYLNENTKCPYAGLSTDEKPIDITMNGALFYEIDTGKVFMFDLKSKSWNEQKGSILWFIYNR